MENPMPCALVTGSSRGIGRGIAISLGREGWQVVVNYAGNREAAEDTCEAVRQAGGQALAVQGDVAKAEDRAHLLAETITWAGAIDLLVNNAGIAPSVRADILDAGEESFDRLITVNLKGPYFLTQAVAKQMMSQKAKGQIINVSSISAYAASTNRGDYCISKAGIGMMTALYAARLADEGIRVYEIRPGVIATDMTGAVKDKYDKLISEGLSPIKRWGMPEDIGRCVVAIARGDLPFSTGEVINVDGGFHLKTL
ncbi:MAG: 3-ketoacyl-ACP reductase [Planctomycetota bacterium]|nr:MAG: 3-ketoacyl-ACP reductase [Planctomycetota bacterium]